MLQASSEWGWLSTITEVQWRVLRCCGDCITDSTKTWPSEDWDFVGHQSQKQDFTSSMTSQPDVSMKRLTKEVNQVWGGDRYGFEKEWMQQDWSQRCCRLCEVFCLETGESVHNFYRAMLKQDGEMVTSLMWSFCSVVSVPEQSEQIKPGPANLSYAMKERMSLREGFMVSPRLHIVNIALNEFGSTRHVDSSSLDTGCFSFDAGSLKWVQGSRWGQYSFL